MPKKFGILLVILAAGFLSSCTFVLEPPATYIEPPYSDHEAYKDHVLVNGFLAADEKLQVPREMTDPSSQVDLDLGSSQAPRKLIFWTKKNGYQVGVNMLVKTSDGWAFLDQERLSGRALHLYRSLDLDGDGVQEILIGVDSGANRTLHIFSIEEDGLSPLDQINYSRLVVDDVNGDGKAELLTTLNNLAGKTASTDINVYQVNQDGKLHRVSRKTIEGYSHEVETGAVSRDQRGLYMITSSDSTSIRATLLLYGENGFHEVMGQDIGYVNALTERQEGTIQDINGDGVLDILTVRFPIDASKREPREYLQIWKSWDGGAGLTNVYAQIDNRSDGYRLRIPVEWLDHLHYSYLTEQTDREIRFYDGEEGVGTQADFSIHTRDASPLPPKIANNLTPIGISPSRDKIYYLRLNDDQFADHPLDVETIRQLLIIEGGNLQNGS